jgi:hypothetical protein
MKLDSRLKKVEQKAGSIQKLWAVFTMKDYPDPVERQMVKQRLLDEYLSQGNARPTDCMYFNEIVGAETMGNKNEYLYSCPVNPLEEIMHRIADNSQDPLA